MQLSPDINVHPSLHLQRMSAPDLDVMCSLRDLKLNTTLSTDLIIPALVLNPSTSLQDVFQQRACVQSCEIQLELKCAA
jgi:hypothetical protein